MSINETYTHIFNIKDITGGAIYFRKADEPKRKWHKIHTATIKNHIFYR